MGTKGQLTKSQFGFSMPVDSPLYEAPPFQYRDIEILMYTYLTDPKQAAALLPEAFELPDVAVAQVIFAKYPFSGVGSYNEVAQTLFCLHNGDPVGYSLRLHVTNAQAMAAGREIGGFAKSMGDIQIGQTTVYLATLDDPPGRRLCTATLAPLQIIPDAVPKTLAFRSLRVIPNPADPHNPSLAQLVGTEWVLESGEMWSARGDLTIESAPVLNPYSSLPIVEPLPLDLAEKLETPPCGLFRGNMSISKVTVLGDL